MGATLWILGAGLSLRGVCSITVFLRAGALDLDFCFSEHFLNGWIDRFPNADVHRYGDAGHYVVEDAHERIIPAMQDFIANNP